MPRDWICLAAAPTFALMALLTAFHGGDPQHMLCSASQNALSFNGMVWMYTLMSVFHSPPWLKLISAVIASAVKQSPSDLPGATP